MAKRYCTFDKLSEYGVGTFKPGSTLGSHHATIESISKQEIIVFGSLDPAKKVRIFPGWTLGYNCGEVWAIKPPHLITDPLLRVLRELKISGGDLEFSDREIRVFSRSGICGAGYSTIGDTIQTLGEGWNRRYQGCPDGWYSNSTDAPPHPSEGDYYSGGEVAIVRGHWCDRNFGQRSRIEKVVVRPAVGRERAAQLIRFELIDKPARQLDARRAAEIESKRQIEQAEKEFNNFLASEDWISIIVPFVAAIVLRKRAILVLHPYSMHSLPDKLFPPFTCDGKRVSDGDVLWLSENGKITIVLESYTFEEVSIRHVLVTRYRNNDPLSHLCKKVSGFQVQFPFFPNLSEAKTLEEKENLVRQLAQMKERAIEHLKAQYKP